MYFPFLTSKGLKIYNLLDSHREILSLSHLQTKRWETEHYIAVCVLVKYLELFYWSALCECSSEVLCASVLMKSGLENRDYGRRGSAALTTDGRRSLGRYSSLTDSSHGVSYLASFIIGCLKLETSLWSEFPSSISFVLADQWLSYLLCSDAIWVHEVTDLLLALHYQNLNTKKDWLCLYHEK
jgi:hypothetical protein